MNVSALYLNRQLMAVFTITLAVLLTLAVGDRLIHFLEKASIGGLPGNMVLYVVSLRLPGMLQLVIPFAFYVSIFLSFGRLYSNQEMIILQSAGMNNIRLLQWLAPGITVLALLVAITALSLNPAARLALEDALDDAQQKLGLSALRPGTFRITEGGDLVTYSEGLSDDEQEILNVFIRKQLSSGKHMTIWAAKGRRGEPEADGHQQLSLIDGRRYTGIPGQADFEVMSFQTFHLKIPTEEVTRDLRDVETVATLSLDQTPEHRAEFHWRIGLPIFFVIISLLAISKAQVKPRHGRFARLAPGLLWVIAYYLLLIANRWCMTEGLLLSALGYWPVHLAFGLVALHGLRRLGRPA